ncbi:MAG: hypothetical protein Q8L75_03235, partial [Acidobacteriota bacterium]|nr:hypothetical protein [Acidobacteriota bacterium]
AARRRRERAIAGRPEAEGELPPFMRPEELPQPEMMLPPLPPAAPARPKPVRATPRLRAPQRPPAAVVVARTRAASAGSPYRRNLRRAVVMAAVLGPCRAISPYDDPRS